MAFNARHRVNHDAGHTFLLLFFFPWRLIARRRWLVSRPGPHAVTNGAGDSMDDGSASYGGGHSDSDLACGYICGKTRDLRQSLIERRTSVPETVRSAGQATVTGFDWPARAVVPPHRGAVKGGFRSLATHLIKTPALA